MAPELLGAALGAALWVIVCLLRQGHEIRELRREVDVLWADRKACIRATQRHHEEHRKES